MIRSPDRSAFSRAPSRARASDIFRGIIEKVVALVYREWAKALLRTRVKRNHETSSRLQQ
jgi:hypothetical protein